MKVTACFNVMFDVEVPEEVVKDTIANYRGQEYEEGGNRIAYSEIYKLIEESPEFKDLFKNENVEGEITGIYNPDFVENGYIEDIWED